MNLTKTLPKSLAAAPTRRIRVVVNPHAGAKGGIPTNRANEQDVLAVMERHRLGTELVVTESEEESIAAARDAVAQGYDVVVAAGGDGSVEIVAGQLVGTKTALGILPLGSLLNTARMLGISRNLDEAASLIAAGNVRAIDVGEAKGTLFFEGGSVGLNAAVFAAADQIDSDGGRLRALWSTLAVLWRFRPSRMVIYLDGRVLTTRALAVSIANGPYTGLGFTISPDAKLDDGLLDVIIFSRFSRLELVRHFGSIAFGRHRYTPKATTYRSARVRIEGVHPLPCRADAHDLGTTPVEFLVHPGALRVIAPPAP